MSEPKEVYLGDGLFASFDGFQIQLRAERHEGNHRVFLEPQVFHALCDYARECGMAVRGKFKEVKGGDDGQEATED